MSRFSTGRIQFGNASKPIDVREARSAQRRSIRVRDASELLAVLPLAVGSSYHFLLTKRFDLMDVVEAMPDRLGSIDRLRLVTLSFNEDNLASMSHLVESGKVSSLSLLCSSFLAGHKPELWNAAVDKLRDFPGVKLACAETHAKVVLTQSATSKLVIEGSANLSSNGGIEQIAVIADAGLHDWHAAWIDELIETSLKKKQQ